MGLQWLSAESRHRHMSHKSAAFYFGEVSLYLVSGGHSAKKQVAITY